MRKDDNEIEDSQRHEVPPYYTWIRHVRGKKTLAEVAIALAYVLMVAVVSLPITDKKEVNYMKRKKSTHDRLKSTKHNIPSLHYYYYHY